MNKTELIAAVAEKTGMSKKDTEAVISATLGTITAALHEEEKVQLMGFGSFEVKKRAARTGRNPRSKETIQILASQTNSVIFSCVSPPFNGTVPGSAGRRCGTYARHPRRSASSPAGPGRCSHRTRCIRPDPGPPSAGHWDGACRRA